MKVLNEINILEMWGKLDFDYSKPEQLNEKEAIYVEVKNHSYDNDWSLPPKIPGWIYIEAWFDNMIEGQKGRRGATRLQWRPDMGLPLFLDGYNNSTYGATMWFVPKVHVGGDWSWKIEDEIEYTKRGQPVFVRFFAEKKK